MKFTFSLAAGLLYSAAAVSAGENCKAGRLYCGHSLRALDGSEYPAIYTQAGLWAFADRSKLEHALFVCAFDKNKYAGYIEYMQDVCENGCKKGNEMGGFDDYCA